MKQKMVYKMTLLTLVLCSYCNAQGYDYVVTTSHDTIYLDKISVTDFEVKTKIGETKKKYKVDEIISYYTAQKKEYYERVPVEKKERKAPDKYDYQRNENFYLEQHENDKKYKFIQRLTEGKVKLFTEVLTEGDLTLFFPNMSASVGSHINTLYYIAINDSKLEPITDESNFKLFDFRQGLTLNDEVYEILKQYLYGNKDISSKLDTLYTSKPKAKEKQIIELINEYNLWVKSSK